MTFSNLIQQVLLNSISLFYFFILKINDSLIDTLKLAKFSYYWVDKKKRLSLDYNNKKSDTIILFLFLLCLKIPWLLRVCTFFYLLLAENIFSLYIIMITSLFSGPPIMQSLWYSFDIIVSSFENLTKYDRGDFILFRNVSWYSITFSHSCPSKNTLFYTFFHLYPKQLSHFRAVLE